MRHKQILFFLLLFAGLVAGPAFADVIRPMQASPSQAQLKSACDAAGGTFGTDAEAGFDTGGYGCTKNNCDGKGGKCVVSCEGGKCHGSTPARVNVTTLVSILQNGNAVIYSQQGQPVGSMSGQATSTQGGAAVIIY